MSIKNYIKKFFAQSEQVNCEPLYEETIEGKAFTYSKAKLSSPVNLKKEDAVTATITDYYGKDHIYSGRVNMNCVVDTIAIFQAKEAFGMTNVVGAAFGKEVFNKGE